ncbi:endonuclease/glycosyl hydrolase [Arabidopsis thaliana]|uniref:Endonuclease/glycosyl hydrolase n=2 Tax=Arabidopsis thaliana TaxID=3702 RepID=Q84N39_ARATH|nr:endonuclease/glycosyl hydrolase [Arabidopsis thaliana]AAP22499.1 hypothetical protein At2g38365 [Arabidopsis thaliana]AAX55147.1 hypothetical protein At2g38365 [Arabidopsis thaliana]AEC09528.1 endonuclease/glycosyl hydrolase [Arabidopsis thaliana]|eukprot:NP_850295.2 endonuclease/glycosyl hydrolase [Arabidopsis thaliana]
MLWTVDRTRIPTNLMVISSKITDDCSYVKCLSFMMKSRTGNILLAQPENLAHDDDLSQSLLSQVTAVWLWTSLSYGGKPIFNRGISQLVTKKWTSTSVQGETSVNQ